MRTKKLFIGALACLACASLPSHGAAQDCFDYSLSPRWIASHDLFGGYSDHWDAIRRLAALGNGDTLLVLVDNQPVQLQVFDARRAPDLVRVGATTLSPRGDLYSLAVRGRRAYVDGETALRIVSLADPATPLLVASVPLPWGSGRLDVAGDLLLRVEGDTLRVMSVANPDTAATLATVALGSRGNDVALADGVAYAGTRDGLVVIDLTTPGQPHIAAVLTDPPWVHAVTLAAGRLYAAGAELLVYDLSDPLSPLLISRAAGAGGDEIAVEGDVALVADTFGFRLCDLADPEAPRVLIHGGPMASFTSGVFLKDGLARVACTQVYNGTVIQTWRLGDVPAAASLGAWVPPPDWQARWWLCDLLGEGGLCYGLFASHSSDDESRLAVVDVSDPASPTLLADVAIPGVRMGRLAKAGDRLAIQAGELTVVDVSEPALPRVLGSAPLLPAGQRWNMRQPQAWGDLVLAGIGETGGLWALFDVGGPQAPTPLGTLPASLQGGRLSFRGDLACVVRRDSLLTFDVADPWCPVPLGAIEPAWELWGQPLIVENTAFVAAREPTEFVLLAVDLSDAGAPRVVARAPVPGSFSLLAAAGSRLYAAGTWDGVHVLDISDPSRLRVVGTVASYVQTEALSACGTGLLLTEGADLSLLPFDCVPPPPNEPPIEDVAPPRPVTLLPPHPNPFNPLVRIPFTLAQAQRARVMVYDLAGRRVATVADQAFDAGPQEVVWRGVDARGAAVASGSYVVRVEGERGRDSRRATLLR